MQTLMRNDIIIDSSTLFLESPCDGCWRSYDAAHFLASYQPRSAGPVAPFQCMNQACHLEGLSSRDADGGHRFSCCIRHPGDMAPPRLSSHRRRWPGQARSPALRSAGIFAVPCFHPPLRRRTRLAVLYAPPTRLPWKRCARPSWRTPSTWGAWIPRRPPALGRPKMVAGSSLRLCLFSTALRCQPVSGAVAGVGSNLHDLHHLQHQIGH